MFDTARGLAVLYRQRKVERFIFRRWIRRMPKKTIFHFLTCCLLLPGAFSPAFAFLGGGRLLLFPSAEKMLSPSFTWGEIPPPTGVAGLSGIYHRLAVVTELSVSGGRFITRAKHTYWCFFPDGRCYYSMPIEGLDNFNYNYVKGMNDLWCCTYKLKGDEGIIAWGTGGTTVRFRRSGSTLLIARDTEAYELLDPCNSLVLEGTYRREDWQEEISSKKGIIFSRDGTFVDEGFLSGAIASWWWSDRGLVDANFSSGSGTYRVAGNSLVLIYADGRKMRANFHLADQATKDEVRGFLISTRRFVRIK